MTIVDTTSDMFAMIVKNSSHIPFIIAVIDFSDQDQVRVYRVSKYFRKLTLQCNFAYNQHIYQNEVERTMTKSKRPCTQCVS